MPPSPSPPRAPPRPPPPQLPAYKHFCRVCSKGFTCGSALGGHMRAHGVGDDGPGADEEDDSLGDDPALRGGADGAWDAAGLTATHVYALRANPNRLTRSCQVCKNCGKEFSSWELFLEHGKCNSGDGDDDGIEEDADVSRRSSSPEADGEEDPALAAGWSKGKRSRRAKLMMAAGDDSSPATTPSRCPAGELEAVNNLLMLSSSKIHQTNIAEADQESYALAIDKVDNIEKRPRLLQPISFAAPAPEPSIALPLALPAPQYVSPVPRGVFECKACKKVFTSHQALGGHRASHKKVKGCFAAKVATDSETPRHHIATADTNDDKGKTAAVEQNTNGVADGKSIVDISTDGEANGAGASDAAAVLSMAIMPIDHEPAAAATALVVAPYKKKAKMHECSVCHRLFTSGQALGGHKRCHWLTSSTSEHANLPALAAEDLVGVACHQLALRPMVEAQEPVLDLTIAANPSPVTASAMRDEVGNNSLHLDATLPVYFQPPAVPSNASHRKAVTSSHDINDAIGGDTTAMEDEADSITAKRAKLSDLKDVNMAGETTPWLQVGLASSSAGDSEMKITHEPATTNTTMHGQEQH